MCAANGPGLQRIRARLKPDTTNSIEWRRSRGACGAGCLAKRRGLGR